jgi:hypothetical protein
MQKPVASKAEALPVRSAIPATAKEKPITGLSRVFGVATMARLVK